MSQFISPALPEIWHAHATIKSHVLHTPLRAFARDEQMMVEGSGAVGLAALEKWA